MRVSKIVGVALASAVVASGGVAVAAVPSEIPYQAPPDSVATIHLTVDLSRIAQGIYGIRMTLPVSSHQLTLAYPKWIPGWHAPFSPITHLAGLVISAKGRRVKWTRDAVRMDEFHVSVPPGVRTIHVRFEMVGMRNADPVLADMAWNTVLLYPLGSPVWKLRYQATIELPKEWKYATSLTASGRDGNTVHFAPSSLYTLIDSPVMAGAYLRRITLANSPRVTLDVFADSKRLLSSLDAATVADYRKLPAQEYAMFGGHHYKHYNFLMALSDYVSNGLEHHQSTEVGAGADYFGNHRRLIAHADLLTHEYTHSWNGKFMRPAGQVASNYQEPRKDGLLWVYEGLTQYIGQVMAARIGLWTKRQYREQLAYWAATSVNRTGRSWRDLEDTAVTGPLRFVNSGSMAPAKGWVNYKRANGGDVYNGAVLLWLDVDTKIRQLSHDQKSLRNFCVRFYGRDGQSMDTVPFTFDDVVRALDKVVPFHWSRFLRGILYRAGPGARAPLAGIARGGWKLVYTSTQSPFMDIITEHTLYGNGTGPEDLHDMSSIGLEVNGDGKVTDVLWKGAAFKGGFAPGMEIVSVDGTAFAPRAFTSAIRAAHKDTTPIAFIVRDKGRYREMSVNYHGGLRYPHLVRIHGVPDYLDEILAPLPVAQR